MTHSASDPRLHFGFALVGLARRWRRAFDGRMATLGLSDAAWPPLLHLDRSGDGITTPTNAPARTGPKCCTDFPGMMALCESQDHAQGEEIMAFSIGKAANWLHQVHRSRAVVGWWPEQFAIEDERTAYKVQDALLKKLVPRQGPLVGYKIALTSPQIWEQTGLRGPAYGPIRKKRVFEHKASVRADQWARLGVELEIIVTVNADVPRPCRLDRHWVDRPSCLERDRAGSRMEISRAMIAPAIVRASSTRYAPSLAISSLSSIWRATTGVPLAIASTIGRPKPSYILGKTKTSASR